MNLKKTLQDLVRVIAEEGERNPEFARRIEGAIEPGRREIEPISERVDEPNGIVGDDIIVDRLWQQQKLRTFEPGKVSHVRF
jgi:hypothetical protein